jgi:hypothetical protein
MIGYDPVRHSGTDLSDKAATREAPIEQMDRDS